MALVNFIFLEYIEEHLLINIFICQNPPSLDPSKQKSSPCPNDCKLKNIAIQKLTTKSLKRGLQFLETSRQVPFAMLC